MSPSTSAPNARQSIVLLVVTIVTAIVLAECYSFARFFIVKEWRAAAAVHGILALLVLGVYAQRGALRHLFSIGPARFYAPALVVVLGSSLLAAASRILGGAPLVSGQEHNLHWILWIPILEEIVFRAGIGVLFRAYAGAWGGGWFAAITFALVHASPTIERVMAGKIGLPLGPFLLGGLCEVLLVLNGRILPAIALHAACNATVIIFAYGDERWLQWLGYLYG